MVSAGTLLESLVNDTITKTRKFPNGLVFKRRSGILDFSSSFGLCTTLQSYDKKLVRSLKDKVHIPLLSENDQYYFKPTPNRVNLSSNHKPVGQNNFSSLFYLINDAAEVYLFLKNMKSINFSLPELPKLNILDKT